MSRKFKLSNDWYGKDECKMFNKTYVQLSPGLTVLVGCNGAGKTTILNQINQYLQEKEIPVLYHSNLHDGESSLKSKAVLNGKFDIVARLVMSSEGENIVNVLEDTTKKMGEFSRSNKNSKELWFLFDAIDSGLSIDNIEYLKEKLIKFVIQYEKNKDVYFVVSANSYEFARNEKCLDVINGNYIKFKDYEEYREFILKSHEQKLARYD